jgi:hypothetical protein
MRQRGAYKPGDSGRRRGVDHPAVQQQIIQILADLRGAGVPLNVSIARGVILGVLERALSGLVSEKFLCSTTWVRDFVYACMHGFRIGHGGQGAWWAWGMVGRGHDGRAGVKQKTSGAGLGRQAGPAALGRIYIWMAA